MKPKRLLSVAVAFLLLLTMLYAFVPSGAKADTSSVSVSGNGLVDGAGHAVTLKGVDISGTEFVCSQNWTNDPFGGMPSDTPQTMAALQSWGINVVRVPLNEDCWLGINGVQIGGATYQAAVKKFVSDLRASGFFVIVDLHCTAPGTVRACAGPSQQQAMADADHSPAFWSSVASTFSGDQGVIFDLFNEPFFYWLTPTENQWDVWLNGGTITNIVNSTNNPYLIPQNWKAAGMNQLVAAVRGTGAKNLLLVNGVNWARDPSGILTHLPVDSLGNTAFGFHSYPSGNPSLLTENASPSSWDTNVLPLATRYPIIVGETGDSTNGPETYLPTFLPWATAHTVSVLAWTWSAWTYPSDVLITDWSGTPTPGEGATFKAWIGGATVEPTPTSTQPPTDTPTPAPTSVPLNNTPCTVTLGGQQETGTCTGTFTPNAPSPTPTPTQPPTATPTPPPPTPTPTNPPTPTPGGGGTGSVIAGMNAQPSMRTWRYNGANPGGWWCVQPNCSSDGGTTDPLARIDKEMALMRHLGVKILRLEYPWPLIETSRGVYNFARADYIMSEANKYGLALQPVLVFTPAWANSGGPTYQPPAADFQAFAQALATRYPAIHYFEMWNEPNYGFNGGGYWWPGSESDYVKDVLCPGAAGVRAAGTGAKVLLGGPSSPDTGWFNNIYVYGGGNCFDIGAFHDYGSPTNDVGILANVLAAHGQSAKPIWVGEFGQQEAGTSDPLQTTLLKTVYTSHVGIAVAEYYNLRDDESYTCCPPNAVSFAHWGLVENDDVTRKQPGFSTYQSLAGGSG